jgi:hypothetical protein
MKRRWPEHHPSKLERIVLNVSSPAMTQSGKGEGSSVLIGLHKRERVRGWSVRGTRNRRIGILVCVSGFKIANVMSRREDATSTLSRCGHHKGHTKDFIWCVLYITVLPALLYTIDRLP